MVNMILPGFSVWYTDGYLQEDRAEADTDYKSSINEGFSIQQGIFTTLFQTEVYATLVCAEMIPIVKPVDNTIYINVPIGKQL